jgi:chromosome partitioning protein
MKCIAVVGEKGGAGKTLLSHVICHGLGVAGVEAYHITTDQRRQVMPADGRYYATLDGRDPETLGRLIDRLSERDGVMVLDGGGNRPLVDEILSAAADLVLVPFQTSADDMRVAAADLDRLPAAVGIPTRWPNNRWEREVAQRVFAKYLESYRSRIAAPVFSMAAFATLVEEGPPSPRINGTCKQIALSVLEQLGLTLFDLRAA